MAKDHGFDGIVKVNATHEVGHLQNWSLDDGVSLSKGSAMRQPWEDARAFNRKWSGSAEAYFDAADLGENALAIGSQVTLHLYPGGDDLGLNVRSGIAHITSVSLSTPKDGWVTATFGFEGDGQLTSETAGNPAAHLMWQILCEEALNVSYYGIAEIEFRETLGGADVSTIGAAVAGADRGAGKTATEAFDDATGTYWGADQSAGSDAWVGQQFSFARAIAEVAITARSDGGFYDQAPRQFQIRYSDDGGTNWITARAVSGEANWSAGETRVYSIP